MTWLQFIIAILTLGLVNGGFFYTINRKMKKTELQEKEIEVIKKQDEEWAELYREEKAKREDLEEKLEELIKQQADLMKQKGLLELSKQQLTWYRCTVNHCPNRKPPHVFDIDGNELEAGV